MADRRDIERLLQDLAQQPGLPKGAVQDIGQAIDTSPFLASVMIQAIEWKSLRRIEVSNQPNESGHYDDNTGTLSISSTLFAPRSASDRLDMLAGTLGHETGHALMSVSAQQSLNKFVYNIETAIKEGIRYGEPMVDVTAHAKQYMVDSRRNEALAELVSMNAVASRVVTVTGKWSEPELLSRLEPTTACVKDGRLERGIHIDARGMQRTGNSIASPAVEAVAVCHFDNSDSSLGVQGKSNYADYYAAYAIGAGASLLKERSAATTQVLPRLGYDLAEMGTDVARLETAGVNLGGQGKAFGFVDTSNGQQREVEVRQLGPLQHRPDLMTASIESMPEVLADNPSHHDHSTYARIQDWVTGTGNWTNEESRNVSAALYRQQAEHPLLQRVDQVTGGLGKDGAHNVFAVYAPFGEKGPFFHAHVDGRQAAQEPAQQNLQLAEAAQRTQSREKALEQTQQHAQQHEQGPKISVSGP